MSNQSHRFWFDIGITVLWVYRGGSIYKINKFFLHHTNLNMQFGIKKYTIWKSKSHIEKIYLKCKKYNLEKKIQNTKKYGNAFWKRIFGIQRCVLEIQLWKCILEIFFITFSFHLRSFSSFCIRIFVISLSNLMQVQIDMVQKEFALILRNGPEWLIS